MRSWPMACGSASSLALLGFHDEYFALQHIAMQLAVEIAPKFEQIACEVLRQLEAQPDRLARVDADPIGRIGIDERRLAPELKLHLGEQGRHELVRDMIQ